MAIKYAIVGYSTDDHMALVVNAIISIRFKFVYFDLEKKVNEKKSLILYIRRVLLLYVCKQAGGSE